MNIQEAIDQVKVQCEIRIGADNYNPISMRGVLYSLGYGTDETDEVIRNVASRGFQYCLDSTIPHKDGERPGSFACYWGPDQLKSRLDCLR